MGGGADGLGVATALGRGGSETRALAAGEDVVPAGGSPRRSESRALAGGSDTTLDADGHGEAAEGTPHAARRTATRSAAA